VKVGHRQATYSIHQPPAAMFGGFCFFEENFSLCKISGCEQDERNH
jgi:hypothetical protein